MTKEFIAELERIRALTVDNNAELEQLLCDNSGLILETFKASTKVSELRLSKYDNHANCDLYTDGTDDRCGFCIALDTLCEELDNE